MAIEKRINPVPYDKQYQTLPCSVCGEKLQLVGMGARVDTETNQVLSRWPVWEKCSKQLHATVKREKMEAAAASRARKVEPSPKTKVDPTLPVSSTIGRVGSRYAPTHRRALTIKDIEGFIDHFTAKHGGPPARIDVDKSVYAQIAATWPITNISLGVDLDLSPGYRYVQMYKEGK